MNKAQKELKAKMQEVLSVDKITCRKDGTVELRYGYFYRHGNMAESWAAKVAKELPEGWEVVDSRDEMRAWPQDSYFLAVVAEKKEQEANELTASLLADGRKCGEESKSPSR